MTDEQIIKAFEEMSKDNHMSTINQMICGDVLDIVSRQKAEIEELHSDKIIAETHEKAAKDLFKNCVKQLKEAKSKAIKEFAEQLCKDRVANDPIVIAVKAELKEMTEEK